MTANGELTYGRRSRLPLTVRLVAVIVSLLTAGLTIAGATMLGILHAQLVGQVYDEVSTVAQRLARSHPTELLSDKEVSLPSNYYVRLDLEDGSSVETVSAFTTAVAGVPEIGSLLEQAVITESGTTEPVTVRSSTGANWIAVAVPMSDYGIPQGVLTVAQPLTAVQETMHNTGLYLLISSGILILIGGVSAFYLVRLSLKPLREIEEVAGRIADGDLSQRVEDLPQETEIGSLARSLNVMLSHIETSFQRQKATEEKMRRFVSDASHELRTPLAAIRGYGELYHMDGVPPDRVPDIMNRISSEATRMGALVEDLLRLARLDEGRRIRKRTVDIVVMLRDAALDLTALNPVRDVSIVGLDDQQPPEHLWIYADPDQISQVLMNLVGNIDRYTPATSPVEFKVGMTTQAPDSSSPVDGDDAQWVVIDVVDHGPGVAADELPRLFERFYRGDSSRSRSTGGTGLGLSIVSAVAHAHEGFALASQTPGGGLTVRLAIRYYDVSPDDDAPEEEFDTDVTDDDGRHDVPEQIPVAEPSDIKQRLKKLFRQ